MPQPESPEASSIISNPFHDDDDDDDDDDYDYSESDDDSDDDDDSDEYSECCTKPTKKRRKHEKKSGKKQPPQKKKRANTQHKCAPQEDDGFTVVDNSKRQDNAAGRQDFRTLMNAPKDIETNSKKYPKALVAIYNACKAHWEIVKDIKQIDGQYMYWNFPCLDWTLPANVGRILAGYLHYDTIENAGSLKGSLHCATAMRSDGVTIRTDTWNFVKSKDTIAF